MNKRLLEMLFMAAVLFMFPVSAMSLHEERENMNIVGEGIQNIPEDLSTVKEATSENGLYNVKYKVTDDIIPFDTLHDWLLSITDANGDPVEGIELEITSSMPHHPHGTITKPKMTRHLGKGRHLVEGMLFHMKGWWVTTIKIKKGEHIDQATFNNIL